MIVDFTSWRYSGGSAVQSRVTVVGMKQTLEVLNAMVSDGVIRAYAIGGAVAAYNYIEATATEDLDILVSFDGTDLERPSGLITLGPILTYLNAKGYTDFRAEGLVVEGWPVQFLPVADALDAEALDQAEAVDIVINAAEGSVSTRVLRPEHVVATALRTGRGKDRLRIMQFLEEQAVDLEALCSVIGRYGLADKWIAFCKVVGIEDPCVAGSPKP